MKGLLVMGLGTAALVLCAVTAAAHAGDGPAAGDDAPIPADQVPVRWTTHAALGADRSGDLRPAARAILAAAAATHTPLTLGAARIRGLAPAAATTPWLPLAFAAPATIRVWRRALDGSTASCSGRVDVIDFATYVKGVLPHEWIRSWQPASLEAGAIAIRTYAAWWVNAGGKYDCADLDDTTASQVYRDEFFPETDAAVDVTAGQFVVAAGGDLVFAEYSAENGDPTALGVDDAVCAGHAVNGHGRGTCQWGTQRWAQDGQTAAWIATHYYPGSELTGGEPVVTPDHPRDPNDPADPDDPGPDGTDGVDGGCSTGAAGGGTLLVAGLALMGVVRRRRASVIAVLFVVLAACTPATTDRPAPRVAVGGDSPLVGAFLRAGADTGVPPELLAAVSYVETRFRFAGQYRPIGRDDHGAPAIGLVALGEGGPRDIARAAELAGLDEALVHTDVDANLHAGAALLVAAAPDARALVEYRAALVELGGGGQTGRTFADEIYARLAHGFTGTDADGASITVSARPEAAPPATGLGTVVQGLGFPGASWNPASSSNYQAASRGADSINYIVIHTVQGSYAGCISWFKNPAAEVSSHYVVRSSDGEITQMVDDSDIAWHDACFNSQSIGIEHEGYVDDPETWFTENMYVESAKLTAWIADRYAIPKDRSHIYGHGDAPDCSDHTDPGPGWDWAHYMDLVATGGLPQFSAGEGASSYPTEMVAGEEAVVWVEFTNSGNTTWDIDQTRIGTAEPQDRASAFFVDGNWLGPNRASGADHSSYGPGATGRFTWVMRAPAVATTTTFDEAFQLVQEGVAWFGPVVHLTITVHPAGGDPGPDPLPGDDDPGVDDGVGAGGCSAAGGGDGAVAVGCAMLLACVRRRRRAR